VSHGTRQDRDPDGGERPLPWLLVVAADATQDGAMLLLLATHSDGSQTLVTLWEDWATTPPGEVAWRPGPQATWGTPTELRPAP
jgi:hypothetical protein